MKGRGRARRGTRGGRRGLRSRGGEGSEEEQHVMQVDAVGRRGARSSECEGSEEPVMDAGNEHVMQADAVEEKVAEKKVRRAPEDVLLQKIVSATQGKDMSDPDTLFQLPFPFLGDATPERFKIEGHGAGRTFKYMGRTGYANLRNVVLGLYPEARYHELGTLPICVERLQHGYRKAALWGTMGSGKSHMLTALACDLIASFRSSSQGKQRAVYIPDCQMLLHEDRVSVFQSALTLSYADDIDALRRIAAVRNQESYLKDFFEAELQRNVCIYLILDQYNALEYRNNDSAADVDRKRDASKLISALNSDQLLITSATANNTNAQNWFSKQLYVTPIFHHGGLDDKEYQSWKTHFGSLGGSATSLKELEGDDELRVEDATGRVPLFLKQWSDYTDSPDKAWQRFINMKEVWVAQADLQLFITSQLEGGQTGPSTQNIYRTMYLQFITGGRVCAIPKMYDCRYLYIEDESGRCVCGMYRDFIAQTLQQLQHSRLAARQWSEAIARETSKEHPNRSLLGFMIEQHMIAEILKNGIPLYGTEVMKCTEVHYFRSGDEALLGIIEGCILYVPDAFNYKRVDAIVRQWIRSTESHGDPLPTTAKEMLNMYRKLPLRVAGVQITIGALEKHLPSESHFCSSSVMEAWYQGWDRRAVGRFFIWYALQSQLGQHARDAEMLSPCLYASKEIRARTRAGPVTELGHITMFFAVDDYEPLLKKLRV